jgi:hypothetical protein
MLNDVSKEIYFRCDDHAECVVFAKHNWKYNDIDYTISIEDAYCGGDYMGIKGRFKRAWHAFWAKPVYYNEVYCQDGKRMKKFLEDCLALMEEKESAHKNKLLRGEL